MMIKLFYSQTGGMQAEKCGQVKRVLTIVCDWYLIIVESLNGTVCARLCIIQKDCEELKP